MASVKTRATRPELAVQKAFTLSGYRISLNAKELPGSPDIVFPDLCVVVFVHGCFWHRHGCERNTTPRSHQSYWRWKFQDNVRRDRRDRRRLRQMGWRTFTVWECQQERDVKRIKRALVALEKNSYEQADQDPRKALIKKRWEVLQVGRIILERS